jgi:hypothetical protein
MRSTSLNYLPLSSSLFSVAIVLLSSSKFLFNFFFQNLPCMVEGRNNWYPEPQIHYVSVPPKIVLPFSSSIHIGSSAASHQKVDNLEDFTNKFEGFELMMQLTLDKLSGFNTEWSTTDALLGVAADEIRGGGDVAKMVILSLT